MKKISTLLMIVLLSVASVAAQTKKPKSGLEIDYVVAESVETANTTVGANLVLGFLALGGTYTSFEDDSESQFSLSAGINKRLYIIGRFLFADVRLGAYYQSYTYGEFDPVTGYGAYANPRVGVSLFKNFAVTAGYRCNFYDFDFNTDVMTNSMTFGVGFLF